MLGMGRAIGETMTVLMATGCAPAMPTSFLDSVRTMTATIAIELGEVPYNTTHYYALFTVGLVLFIITFIVNMVSDIVLRKYQKVTR
jgi:phosphate transport system permease protein